MKAVLRDVQAEIMGQDEDDEKEKNGNLKMKEQEKQKEEKNNETEKDKNVVMVAKGKVEDIKVGKGKEIEENQREERKVSAEMTGAQLKGLLKIKEKDDKPKTSLALEYFM